MKFIPALSPRFELDHLLLPYAERLCDTVLISAAEYTTPGFTVSRCHLWLDSGGFAALHPDAEVVVHANQGHLIRPGRPPLTPQSVHELARTLGAQVEFTLDFPTRDDTSRAHHHQLSTENALWTLKQPRERQVYAAVQPGQDLHSILQARPDGIGLGGLVPFARDFTRLHQEVSRLRRQLPDHLPLHVFGIGHPEALKVIRNAGATSADSSSPQRTAVSGRTWDGTPIPNPSLPERLHLAVRNLQRCLEATHEPVL